MSFLPSLAVLFLSALALGAAARRAKLPPLIGMLLTGILLGPYALSLIAPDILAISPDLRQLALVVILTRAGLSLDITDLRRVGRPAVLLCFVPACCEIVGYLVLAPLLLHLSPVESALLGSVMGAVSPAVVVPRMLKLQKEGYGTDRGIPKMLMAGASCDDVFVIVLFSALLGMAQNGDFDAAVFWRVPVSIVLGVAVGLFAGWLLSRFFRRFSVRDTVKVLLLLSISFLFVGAENALSDRLPFSGLLAVISLGVMFNRCAPERAARMSARYERLWVCAEILLFVLVGAEVDISYALSFGGAAVLLLFGALFFRMAGVFLSLLGTPLSFRERLFCAIAYLPKATVQAAIGAIPLAAGLPCGNAILSCAVLAILLTAPLGAMATDLSYKKLLRPSVRQAEESN